MFYGPNHIYRTRGLEIIKNNPNNYKHYHLLESTREEMRKSSAELLFFNKEKIGLTYDMFVNQPNVLSNLINSWVTYAPGFSVKNGVHLSLYAKAVHSLGTEKHKKYV